MIESLQAVVLGLVQGITAWIPVSSKTQVILVANYFYNIDFLTAVSFALMVHIGDLVATLYLFRKELAGFLRIKPRFSGLKKMNSLDPEQGLFWFVVISVLFSGAIGLPLYLATKKHFSELPGTLFLAIVGLILILLGIVMWRSGRQNPCQDRSGLKQKISLADTILAGCAQGLSVVPGISRSGITESTLLLRGYVPYQAVRLSFFMSIPMIILSISAFFIIEGFGLISFEAAALGIVAAFIASLVTMRTMLLAAEKVPFCYFNIGIGILAMVPLLFQWRLGA